MQYIQRERNLCCIANLDDSFLISAREVLGLPLSFFPLPHHLDVNNVTSDTEVSSY